MENDRKDVVVMCGVSGSGKTYYSRRLEKEGYLRLSVDEYVWNRYGAGLTAYSPERRREIFAEGASAMESMLAWIFADAAEDPGNRGKRVVIDSTMCRRFKRDSMRALCRSLGVSYCFIYLDAPLDVLCRRLSLRTGSGPDDQVVTPEEVESFYRNFDRPQPDETDIISFPVSSSGSPTISADGHIPSW